MISGVYSPATRQREARRRGRDRLRPPPARPRGLSRTFQNLQIFQIDDGAGERHRRPPPAGDAARSSPTSSTSPRSRRRARSRRGGGARALLDRVRLGNAAEKEASSLSYGALKRLEIARALALKPRVLLLDEPAAGCNAVETEEIDHLIAEVAASGIAILLVEHDMKMVMRISNHIVVLDHGEKIAEGDPAAVSRDPDGHRGLSRSNGGCPCLTSRACARATAASRCCTASTSR